MKILITIALITVICAVGLWFVYPTSTEQGNQRVVVHLNRLQPASRVLRRIAFSNPANAPVSITDVHTSCMCTSAVPLASTFAPGEQITVDVTIEAKGAGSRRKESVLVKLTEPTGRTWNQSVDLLFMVEPFIIFARPESANVTQDIAFASTSDAGAHTFEVLRQEIPDVPSAARLQISPVNTAKSLAIDISQVESPMGWVVNVQVGNQSHFGTYRVPLEFRLFDNQGGLLTSFIKDLVIAAYSPIDVTPPSLYFGALTPGQHVEMKLQFETKDPRVSLNTLEFRKFQSQGQPIAVDWTWQERKDAVASAVIRFDVPKDQDKAGSVIGQLILVHAGPIRQTLLSVEVVGTIDGVKSHERKIDS